MHLLRRMLINVHLSKTSQYIEDSKTRLKYGWLIMPFYSASTLIISISGLTVYYSQVSELKCGTKHRKKQQISSSCLKSNALLQLLHVKDFYFTVNQISKFNERPVRSKIGLLFPSYLFFGPIQCHRSDCKSY